jgi:hypothetical protein
MSHIPATRTSNPTNFTPRTGLITQLKNHLGELRRAALRDVVLTRLDLLDALYPLRKHGLSVAVILRAHGSAVPTMSVVWTDPIPILVDDRATLTTQVTKFQQSMPVISTHGAYSEVHIAGSHLRAKQAAQLVAEIADVSFVQSLSARNIARDRRVELVDRLRHAIDNGRITILPQLASFLKQYLRMQIDIVEYTGNSLRSFETNPASDSEPQIIAHLRGKINKNTSPAVADKLASIFRHRIIESIENEKPFYFTSRDTGLHVAAKLSFNEPSFNYLIIPVRSRTDPVLKRSAALIIHSDKRQIEPRHELINSVNRCVDLYLARKYRVGQTETLALITRKLEDSLLVPPLTGYRDLEQRLRKVFHAITDAVVESTAAYSMAILELHRDTHSLSNFFVYEHSSARTHLASHGAKPAAPSHSNIPIRRWRTRLSAFSFLHADRFRSVYIPNLRKTPAQYHALGLGQIESRRHSGSEVSIPIKVGHFVLGVVNFEARYKNAFDSDISFLEAVVSGISSLITCYYQSSDAMWLLDNVAAQQALHELKNHIELSKGNDVHLEEAKRRVKLILGRDVPRPSTQSLLHTLHSISSFFDGIISNDRRVALKKYFTYDIVDDTLVTIRTGAAIEVILKNLLQNWLRYGTTSAAARDRLVVRFSGAQHTISSLYLEIEASFHSWHYELILDNAFVTPARSSDKNGLGLYIIGVITRALRGTLSFTRTPIQWEDKKTAERVRILRLHIKLPLLDQTTGQINATA